MVNSAMTTTSIRRLLAVPFAHLIAPDGLPRRFTSLVQDSTFLGVIHGFERQLAKVMATALGVVLVLASVQLMWLLGHELIDPHIQWFGEDLIRLLDQVLVILIALEVMQNLTAYLRDHVVQIELVLVTALTALAREVIVMSPHSEHNPFFLIGIGVAVLAFAATYWLVRHSHASRPPSDTVTRQGAG